MSSGFGSGYIKGILNSPEEYLQLVFDLITIGSHSINPYAESDEDNLSLSDSFYQLTEKDAEKYLGIMFPWSRPPPKDPSGWYTEEEMNYIEEQEEKYSESIEPLKLSDLTLSTESEFPQPENFPIAIHWCWEDTFDRWGDVVARSFSWVSLSQNIFQNSVSEPVRKHTLWTQRYGPLYEYCCEMEEFMNGNNYQYDNPDTNAIIQAQSKLLKEKWGLKDETE